MMKTYLLIISVFFYSIAFHTNSLSQAPAIIKHLKGQILDNETGHAVEYVTIAVINKKTKKLVTGTITDSEGRFAIKNIKEGNYYLEISFMGYKKKTIDNIEINDGNPVINLGSIKLERAEDLIEELEVFAEKGAVDYQIDKKVVNVSKQYTTVAGTAIDILENVPSVTVDVEGNLSLRGSTGFTVLIDGKPSALEGSEALVQIPASTIQNIEIITNPSVKFDPDGTAGIINVITKKNKLKGINGIANLNIGLDEKYGGDILLNFRKKKINFFVGADYNDRQYPGFEFSERRTTSNNITTYTLSDGTSIRKGNRWSIRSGISIDLDTNKILSFDVR